MDEDKGGLYRAVILEHAKNPRNSGRVENPTLQARASNPLCGDELELTASLEGGILADIRFQVRGCAIVTAAASLMSQVVQGQDLEVARVLGRTFAGVMEGEASDLPADLAALEPLVEVKKHRSRIKCALLPWHALADAEGAGG